MSGNVRPGPFPWGVMTIPVEIITGNEAAAYAVQRAGVEMIAAYPITPQTAVVETLAGMWSRGELKADFVSVDSEHSVLAACIGAAAAGVRTFAATSSQGLAYMHEMLHWASGGRFPLVLVDVNRALGAPWCLDPDHGDSLSQRDTGWIQLYCTSAQEVFDLILQAYALAEMLLLPCMVVYDGFYISHTYEAVEIPAPEETASFPGPPAFAPQVDPNRPCNLHGLVSGEAMARLVRERHRDHRRVPEALAEINRRFAALFGRCYLPAAGAALEGAGTVLITAGSNAETLLSLLPLLKEHRTGLITLRLVHPFPGRAVRELLQACAARRVVVIDRTCSPGTGGILAQKLRSALYDLPQRPVIENLILAGGLDLSPDMLERLLGDDAAPADFAGERWGVEDK